MQQLTPPDLNLLHIGLKYIEHFVAQAIMSDRKEHFYDGAFQGFIDAPQFHESFVSIDSKGTRHEIEFNGFKFLCFIGINHFSDSDSVSIAGVPSVLPSAADHEFLCDYVGRMLQKELCTHIRAVQIR
jgi:hypothetical protein